ncbi:RsmE family RNA methyltransferase [Mollicutes bacterium LVI A0039]|nr:RsmE family RNA methyltransferase [Mollicutes bacterium LVI A0039]
MLRVFYKGPFTAKMVIDDKEKYHHLAIVLRSKIGDEVYLVNDTEVAKTEIVAITKSTVELQLLEQMPENNELDCHITLGFGPLKGDNTQLVVQKAVELGAKHIDLINFKRNVSKFDSTKAQKKITKFEKIIEGACLQSRRNIVPTIAANVKLSASYLEGFDLVLVAYENERSNHILKYQPEITKAKKILLLIGPEGGIADDEIDLLSQFANVKIATLGKRILRAETASISGMSIIDSILEGK